MNFFKMNKYTHLTSLVSNVVSQNTCRHCRLCLREIKDTCVRFDDYLSLDQTLEDNSSLQSVGDVLNKLLGKEVCEEIPGLEVICLECIQTAVECNSFIERCKNSYELLYKIFNDLNQALNVVIEEPTNKDQHLFVVVSENESKVTLVDKNQKVKSPTKRKALYECQLCNYGFRKVDDLKAHNLANHNIDLFVCKTCSEIFTKENEMEEHVKINHSGQHICQECGQFKNSLESLKQHLNKVHQQYICKECGKSCNGLDKLIAHEEKHSTKSECSKCGKVYLTRDFYLKHVELCQNDLIDPHPYRAKIEKSFICKNCGKGYSTSGGLRVHERFVHGNAKPHICEYCGKKFTAPSYLKIHLVKHTGEKKFKCNICSNNFVSKEALLYHTRRHTGEKPYSCKFCNERFVNASARAEHIKFKHTGPTLTCDICNRKFFTLNFLRQHINRHHDPSSKLYSGRNLIPPNMPGKQNMRIKVEVEDSDG